MLVNPNKSGILFFWAKLPINHGSIEFENVCSAIEKKIELGNKGPFNTLYTNKY